MIAEAIHTARPDALPVIVPRHAERRAEVCSALTEAGFQVTLRSAFTSPPPAEKQAFVIDTTGELATWTCHADVVIIGKSFLSVGGQNPAEAILAGKPLILGPHMENFQPLTDDLLRAWGAISCPDSVLRPRIHPRRSRSRKSRDSHRQRPPRPFLPRGSHNASSPGLAYIPGTCLNRRTASLSFFPITHKTSHRERRIPKPTRRSAFRIRTRSRLGTCEIRWS